MAQAALSNKWYFNFPGRKRKGGDMRDSGKWRSFAWLAAAVLGAVLVAGC